MKKWVYLPLDLNDKGAEDDKIHNDFYDGIEEVARDVPYRWPRYVSPST